MNRAIASLLTFLVLWLTTVPVVAQDSVEAPVDSILNWRVISPTLYTAGQPGPEHMASLKKYPPVPTGASDPYKPPKKR